MILDADILAILLAVAFILYATAMVMLERWTR